VITASSRKSLDKITATRKLS